MNIVTRETFLISGENRVPVDRLYIVAFSDPAGAQKYIEDLNYELISDKPLTYKRYIKTTKIMNKYSTLFNIQIDNIEEIFYITKMGVQ